MGKNTYRLDYKCDCGIDYGSCGRVNTFILEEYRGTDTFILYHKMHGEKFKLIFGGEDIMLNKLLELVQERKDAILTQEESLELTKARGW